MRYLALAVLLSMPLAGTAAAQTTAPSATPTGGAVGSAALNNGYPGAGGAVALPAIANSNTTTRAPLAGMTTPPAPSLSITSTNSGGAAPGGTATAGSSGQTSGAGGGGGSGVSGGAAQSSGPGRGSRGGGANTAGAASATGSAPGIPTWVLCPPSGAPGLEPLFTGTALSCAP